MSRELGAYSNLERVEDEDAMESGASAEPEVLRFVDSRTGASKQRVPQPQWAESSGVPIISARLLRLPAVLAWVVALFLCCFIPLTLLWASSASQRVSWSGPLNNVDVRLSNCDVIFRPSLNGKAQVTASYWLVKGGKGSVRLSTTGKDLVVELSQPARSEYFPCHAIFHLPDLEEQDTSHANTMKISSRGSDMILLQSDTRIVVEKLAKFQVTQADIRMTQLESPRISVSIHGGVMALRWGDSEEASKRVGMVVDINSTAADVLLQVAGGSLSAECSDDTTMQSVVGDGASVGMKQGKLSDQKVGPGEVYAMLTVVDASVAVHCEGCSGSVPHFRGDKQKSPGLTNRSKSELRSVKKWVDQQGVDPYIVYINAVGAGSPQGRWLMMSSPIYLAFPLHLFALASAGMLAPRHLEVTINVMGASLVHSDNACNSGSSGSVARALLSTDKAADGGPINGASDDENAEEPGDSTAACSEADETLDRVFSLLNDWAVEAEVLPRTGSFVWEQRDANPIVVSEHKGIIQKSDVHLELVWTLRLAAILNLFGSVISAAYLLVLLRRSVMPWLKSSIIETQLEIVASHRLHYTVPLGNWHVLTAMNEGPHGVILRWVSRPKQDDFESLLVIVKGLGPSGDLHQFSVQVDRTLITVPDVNSGVVQQDSSDAHEKYVVQLLLSSAAVEPGSDDDSQPVHQALRPWYKYSFRIQGLDYKGAPMDISNWSSAINLRPPWSVFDYPGLVTQVFNPVDVKSLELFLDQYGTAREMSTFVSFADVEVCFNTECAETELLVSMRWHSDDGNVFDLAIEMSAYLRHDKAAVTPDQQNVWYAGFTADTVNIFGQSIASIHKARGKSGQNDLVYDLGQPWTKSGGHRIDRKVVLMERKSSEQTEVEITVKSKLGQTYAKGGVTYKQILARWADQRHPWAHKDPYDIPIEGATVRCNILLGEYKNQMMEMPQNMFTTIAPGDLWFHGQEKTLGWHLPVLTESLCNLGFLETEAEAKPSYGISAQEALVFTLEVTCGDASVLVVGEHEADLSRITIQVPSDTRLNGPVQVRVDTVWIQLKDELPRYAKTTIARGSGFDRNPKGRRWANLSELVSSSAVHVNDGTGWKKTIVRKSLAYRDKIKHVEQLTTHGFKIERPVLIQEFELAYAAWCRLHGLRMAKINEVVLEANQVCPMRVTEMQLKVVQGIRVALPFESPLQYLRSDGGTHVSTADITLLKSGNSGGASRDEEITTAAQPVQVLQGFNWRARSWTFEPELASRSNLGWQMRAETPRSKTVQRSFIVALSWLEAVFSYLVQLVLIMSPSLLAFLMVVMCQLFGLMYEPSFVLRDDKGLATGWITQPSHLKTVALMEKRPLEILPAIFGVVYAIMAALSMFYMHFGKYDFRSILPFVDKVSQFMFALVSFVIAFAFIAQILWILLGCMLEPERFMPLGVMILSAFGLAKSLWTSLTEMKDEMLKIINKFIDYLFGLTLDRLLRELDREEDLGSLNKSRTQFKMCIIDEVTEDIEKALSKQEAKKAKRLQVESVEKEGQGLAEGDDEEEGTESAPSEYLELLEGRGGKADLTLIDDQKKEETNFDKMERVYVRLCDQAPIVESVRGTLEEPQQLALKVFEERQEQIELIETRFLNVAGGSQMAELYEEKLEKLEDCFMKVIDTRFEEDKLIDQVAFFIDTMLPQTIQLQAQRLLTGAAQVRRAIQDKWPQAKKAGIKLDLKMKLSETMSASTASGGSKSSSSRGSDAFSNEEIVGMTLYEMFCSDGISIFPKLSEASRDCPDFEDLEVKGNGMERIAYVEEVLGEDKVKKTRVFDMTLNDLVNVEGIPLVTKPSGGQSGGGSAAWSVELLNSNGSLNYAFEVTVSSSGAFYSHRTQKITKPIPIQSSVYFIHPRDKVQLFLRRTRYGIALWVTGHRVAELDFRTYREEAQRLLSEKVTQIRVKGLKDVDIQCRDSIKEPLRFQGEDLDTFELQEQAADRFNSFVMEKVFGRTGASKSSVELRRMEVVRVAKALLDGCLWYDEYERLIMYTLGIKVSPEYVKALWLIETKHTLLLPVERVAPSIMWLVGKMIWPTAFVLMCRHFELFPEVFNLTQVLSEKDAKDIAEKIRDESHDRIEDEVEQMELDAKAMRNGFFAALRAVEKEQFDQVQREASFKIREQGADRRNLRALKEKKTQLRQILDTLEGQLEKVKDFGKDIDEGKVDPDILDKKPQFEEYLQLQGSEQVSVQKQIDDIDEEMARLVVSIRNIGAIIDAKKAQGELQMLLMEKEQQIAQYEIQRLKEIANYMAQQQKLAAEKAAQSKKPEPKPTRPPFEDEALRKLRSQRGELYRRLEENVRAAFAHVTQLRADKLGLEKDIENAEGLAAIDEDHLDELRQKLDEKNNELEDVDINNLSMLYPLYQISEEMRRRVEDAMKRAGMESEHDERFDDVVKQVWGVERKVVIVDTWDPDEWVLTKKNSKLQRKLEDWILEAKLSALMSQRRDQVLQDLQQKQIGRPPEPLDIEEADDAEWKTSKAFEYMWELFGEKASDAAAFTEEFVSPKNAVPFLRYIFFDTLTLTPGLIETDIEASCDLEQLPSHLQAKVEEKRLFRVTDREVDHWRFVPNVAADDLVWNTHSGDMIVNAMSSCTDMFHGNITLRQAQDTSYIDSVSGNIWVRQNKGTYLCTRGIWFDAFVELMNDVGMPIGRTSSWILWNLVTSPELMRADNVDLIMCKEVRLLAEVKAIRFSGADLGKSPDQKLGAWSLLMNSDRISKLRGLGRAHPRPEMLEADKELVLAQGRSEKSDGGERSSSKGSSQSSKKKDKKRKSKNKGAKEHIPKIGVIKVSTTSSSHLVFLEHQQDTLTLQLMVGDKVEGVGSFDWKQAREEAILSTDHHIELLRPVTKASVGTVVLRLKLDDCYKEIFAALDSDETQQMAAQAMEQREHASEVERERANAFMSTKQVPAPRILHSSKSGGNESDKIEMQKRAVKDWNWGFASPNAVKENLLKVLNHTPFVSKSMFEDFLKAVQIDLPDKVIDSIWDDKLEKACPLMLRWGEKIVPVRGLVTLSDCWKHLSRHIILGGKRTALDEETLKTKPALSGLGDGGIPVGGMWFTTFYNTLMSTCQVVVPEATLRQVYTAHLDPQTGLMPLDQLYDAVEKIGRPGLPFETFRAFIQKLGIKIDDEEIALAFQQVDVNQNNCLDSAELRAGTMMLLMQTVPLMLLEKQQLTIRHIVPHILSALAILGSLFTFLLLAFTSFERKKDGSVFQTLVQSSLAFGATLGVKSESDTVDLSKMRDLVVSRLEQIFGVVVNRAALGTAGI